MRLAQICLETVKIRDRKYFGVSTGALGVGPTLNHPPEPGRHPTPFCPLEHSADLDHPDQNFNVDILASMPLFGVMLFTG